MSIQPKRLLRIYTQVHRKNTENNDEKKNCVCV